jgi:phenylacetate-CoA ligase
VELIEPASGRPVAISDGAVGELVYTSLLREGQPVFRYRSHDVARVVSTAKCDCGRHGFRFEILGRSDGMLIVKGVNLFPESLQDVISRYDQVLTGEYRVVVLSSGPYEHVDVRVEVRAELPEGEQRALKAELERALRQSLSVKFEVEWVPRGTFPRGADKSPRIERRSPVTS